MQIANFYIKRDDQTIQCLLCCHYCSIKNGQAGICGARINIKGELKSLVYGYPTALNLDPVEKKPLFHFLPGSFTFSLGTYGCNFFCANCQNWDVSQSKDITDKINGLNYWPPEKIIAAALNCRAKSISYTYNEPTIFTEYALEIMKLAKINNLKNIWVSNGYMSQECLMTIIPYLEAINVDLKSLSDHFYLTNCQASVRPVLENLKKIKSAGVHLEITTLIVPILSDDVTMLTDLADFIVKELGTNTPWHISKFSPDISWKLKNLPATEDSFIHAIRQIGKDAGLKYVYAGNVVSDCGENTYCSHCGELAITRHGYDITRHDKLCHCLKCNTFLDIID